MILILHFLLSFGFDGYDILKTVYDHISKHRYGNMVKSLVLDALHIKKTYLDGTEIN